MAIISRAEPNVIIRGGPCRCLRIDWNGHYSWCYAYDMTTLPARWRRDVLAHQRRTEPQRITGDAG